MNKVTLKNGKTVDIDTLEGCDAYLKDEGVDFEEYKRRGLKHLKKMLKKSNEET